MDGMGKVDITRQPGNHINDVNDRPKGRSSKGIRFSNDAPGAKSRNLPGAGGLRSEDRL